MKHWYREMNFDADHSYGLKGYIFSYNGKYK